MIKIPREKHYYSIVIGYYLASNPFATSYKMAEKKCL